MIDHYYDKLLHIQRCSSESVYLQEQLQKRLQVMVDVCLAFGRTGFVDVENLDALVAKWLPSKTVTSNATASMMPFMLATEGELSNLPVLTPYPSSLEYLTT